MSEQGFWTSGTDGTPDNMNAGLLQYTVAASRMAAAKEGILHFASDTLQWSRDNGTTWDNLGSPMGDVSGPGSATDNAICRFNGTGGKTIQDYTSGAPTISDTGAMTLAEDLSFSNTDPIINANTGFLYLSPATPQVRISESNSGGSVVYYCENTSNTNDSDAYFWALVAGTSGGSPFIRFNIPGRIDPNCSAGYQNGANERFEIHAHSNIEGANDILRLKLSDGVLDVLGDSGLTAATVGNFDELDDAVVLQKWAHGSVGDLPEFEWDDHKKLLFEKGILAPSDHDPTGARYHIRVQPMFKLLAGGIYQTRWMVDQLFAQNLELAQQNHELKERVRQLELLALEG